MNRKIRIGKLNRGWGYFVLVVLITSMYFVATLPHIDDVAHNIIFRKNTLNAADMKDSDSDLDHIEGNTLVIDSGKGLKLFKGQVDLQEGDALKVSFTAINKTDKKIKLTVDLYGEGFDDPCDEFYVKLSPGKMKIQREIEFYRGEYPDSCQLRVYTSDNGEVEIKGFKTDHLVVARNNRKLVLLLTLCVFAVLFITLAFLILYVISAINRRRSQESDTSLKLRFSRDTALFASVVIFVTILLLCLYRKADILFPLVYSGGDEMGVYYLAKNIDQNGLSLANALVGGLSGGDMFDYPYSDSLSFLCVKLIGLFTDNPYLIINLFYFANYYLIAIIATAVSRNLKISRSSSFVIGILFAFSPFIQMRYAHIWLTPYYVLPVACMLSIDIIKGKIPGQEDCEERNRMFWTGMILSFLCSFTGMYYAYFACAVFAASMVIRIINTQGKNFKGELYPLAYIASAVTGVVINVVPNLIYWVLEGTNPYSQIAVRNRGDVETFGLKLVQMILPRIGHRIELFSKIAEGYYSNYPLVNENATASIGIIASIGLLISLLLIFSDKKDYKEISWLNFATFIIATIGGVGSIISIAVVLPMRCYNRMSLIIMFLSLLIIGRLIDKLKDKTNYLAVICISLCILAVGIFDQTTAFIPYDNTEFNNSRQFFGQIESEMNAGDMIFTLPYLDWPSSSVVGSYGMFNGYIETDDLHWSYGAMEGREEAQWQKAVAECSPYEIVKKVKYAGYDGIYMDKRLYERNYKKIEGKAESVIESITKETGSEPLISEDGEKYFWKISSNI